LKSTPKRLIALLAASLGLGALLRRRAETAPAEAPAPADELKAKLAATREPEPESVAPPESVDERRADAHARARHAIEELGENRG
jgi:hypothetical protein